MKDVKIIKTAITNENKRDFAVPYEENSNVLFLPLKAMQELFHNTYPEGSVIIEEPKLAPEKDGFSYITCVKVFKTFEAREKNIPDYSRWAKFNPATDEDVADMEDPFNAVSRVAEYKALEAIGCGLNFDKELYMQQRFPAIPEPNIPGSKEDQEFIKSFEPLKDSVSESKIESKPVTPAPAKAKTASTKAPTTVKEETSTVVKTEKKVDKVEKSEPVKQVSEAPVATPEKASSVTKTVPEKNEPIANSVKSKPAVTSTETPSTVEAIPEKKEEPVVPKAKKPTEAQIEAAKKVVSSYRNYANMTMEEIALSAKASKGMTLEEVAKSTSKAHTGWNMIRWFATSNLAASAFPKESAAAKILIAAYSE